jgi:hypothetical protein
MLLHRGSGKRICLAVRCEASHEEQTVSDSAPNGRFFELGRTAALGSEVDRLSDLQAREE